MTVSKYSNEIPRDAIDLAKETLVQMNVPGEFHKKILRVVCLGVHKRGYQLGFLKGSEIVVSAFSSGLKSSI